MTGEPCTRISANIGGEDCYIVLGSDFVEVVYPEYRAEKAKTRKAIEELCKAITEAMERRAGNE